jgi:hypothetical protein
VVEVRSEFRAVRPSVVARASHIESCSRASHVLIKSKDLHVVRHRLVDRASVLSRLQRLSTALECNEAQLRNIVLLELWLRRRVDDRSFGDVPSASPEHMTL